MHPGAPHLRVARQRLPRDSGRGIGAIPARRNSGEEERAVSWVKPPALSFGTRQTPHLQCHGLGARCSHSCFRALAFDRRAAQPSSSPGSSERRGARPAILAKLRAYKCHARPRNSDLGLEAFMAWALQQEIGEIAVACGACPQAILVEIIK